MTARGPLVNLLWPVGAYVCLALSYRGPLGLDERGVLRWRSPWLWVLAVPLAARWIQIASASETFWLPEAPVATVLTAGLLYAAVRRLRPLPGAAPWVSATWPLVALMVPMYLLNVLATNNNPVPELQFRHVIAAAITIATLLILLGLHLATTRRARTAAGLSSAEPAPPTPVPGDVSHQAGGRTGPAIRRSSQ